MSAAGQFQQCLADGDFVALRAMWRDLMPHLPQLETDEQAEIAMHRARTEAASIVLSKRAYSHRLLLERGYPSGLPDDMKPECERLYPRVASAVGISVNFSAPFLKPAAVAIRGVMEIAVEHCYADGQTDPEFVKARMAEARALETKRLFGSLTALPKG
jgi:hypothetical protein